MTRGVFEKLVRAGDLRTSLRSGGRHNCMTVDMSELLGDIV